jgi:hypothetical protein
VPAAISTQALSIEEAKLRRVEESIRVFLRVADPKFRQIVPMRYFNLMLSPAEIDAYMADYLEEVSPRADVARMLLRVVSLTARTMTEIEELKRSASSRSMWRLHADSLVVLIDLAKRLPEAVERLVSGISQQPAQTSALQTSIGKLQERSAQAERLLAQA